MLEVNRNGPVRPSLRSVVGRLLRLCVVCGYQVPQLYPKSVCQFTYGRDPRVLSA